MMAMTREEHEKEMDFLGSRDWIDRFGRHFYPSTHSHLDKPGQGQGNHAVAEAVRETGPEASGHIYTGGLLDEEEPGQIGGGGGVFTAGLEGESGSYEILFELGLLYYEDRHEPMRARNLWEAALRRWRRRGYGGQKAGSKSIATRYWPIWRKWRKSREMRAKAIAIWNRR